MKIFRITCWLITSIIPLAVTDAAILGFEEDFNGGDTANWGGGSERYTAVSTGGVGGGLDGFLEVANDTGTGNLGGSNSQVEFTGDLISDGVTKFSFWLKDIGDDDDLEIHVGVGEAFANVWFSQDGFLPSESDWEKFSVDIIDSSKWTQTKGSGTFADAISNSNRLVFRHDLSPLESRPDLISGEFGIDRIRVVPETNTLPLLLLGFVIFRFRCLTVARAPSRQQRAH